VRARHRVSVLDRPETSVDPGDVTFLFNGWDPVLRVLFIAFAAPAT
jgi:hypothetical protein